MATNADEPEETKEASEESNADTVDDAELRQALADADKPTSEGTSEEKSEDTTLKTEVPSVPERDLAWYQKAYPESSGEALRLKKENDDLKTQLDKKVETPPVAPVNTVVTNDEVLTPEQLYVRTQLIKESDQAFAQIVQKYPDANSPENRDRFKQTSEEVSKVIVASEKRFPEALELYEKTAVILGLQPDNSEAVSSAVKDASAAPRTSSAPASPTPLSRVTEEMIAENQKWYPNKSRDEIIKELEPYIK